VAAAHVETVTAPTPSVFSEPLAQAREALAIAWPEGDHAEPNVFTDALAALDLIEQRAKEMEAGNERLRETLARVRPDIDPEAGYGRQEAI
jgi:hypothetical protein